MSKKYFFLYICLILEIFTIKPGDSVYPQMQLLPDLPLNDIIPFPAAYRPNICDTASSILHENSTLPSKRQRVATTTKSYSYYIEKSYMQKSRTNYSYACPINKCGQTFASQKSFDKHITQSHDKKPHLKCPIPDCGKTFKLLHSLTTHFQIFHS